MSERLKREMMKAGATGSSDAGKGGLSSQNSESGVRDGIAGKKRSTSHARDEYAGKPVEEKGSIPSFVHLHTHSAYSLLEGALKLPKLIELAVDDRQPALAITDTNNLFAALEFSQKTVSEGLQPIIGCFLEVDFEDSEEDATALAGNSKEAVEGYPSLVLLAASEIGGENLIKLVSKAYMGNEDGARPHITVDALVELNAGIILLSGGYSGPADQMYMQGNSEKAEARLEILKAGFGDRFYIELQRHPRSSRKVEDALVSYAYDNDVPLVATNEPFFAVADDYEAHDALMCIAKGRYVSEDDRPRVTPDHYFKSQKEMVSLFADIPEAIENTIEIAKRCSYKVNTRDPILPSYTGADKDNPKEALALEFQELKAQSEAGLDLRLEVQGLSEGYSRKDYDERLKFELDTIEGMGFPGYFLIVADFIKWAKEQGIPVGPGRGSGAGSLVAWSLTITDLDPMRFSLLFERFLNPERVSMPDFDIDFCQDRREEVIRYVQEKYGREQVAQIITFGSLQARAVLRDVGRVLQMPYGQVDRLCKMVPNNPANPTSLAEAVETEDGLKAARKDEEIVDKLISIGLKLEGLNRHASTHAAGIVIGDRPLDNLVPLYRDPRSNMPVTQYNMKWVEQAGLVKFDFLGLKTLTVLETAKKLIAQRGIDIDFSTIPLDDEKTFAMLQQGETVGVFQLESQGMRKALIGMRPDRFEDIIALVALYRPGPMDNIPTYNARKHGEEEPDYLHEKIRPVLEETYGVIIYQEQVMQVAQILAGYSLGQADLLRRAMGKKIRAEMDKQRVPFVKGAVEREVPKETANLIFDLLAKFAEYGFNKSHAAAYALVSYHTAWLKANYPTEFLAASMTLDMGNTDKLSDFFREARRADIKISPPSVTTSSSPFTVKDDVVYYSLAAIKGVGTQAVDHIVTAREAGGPFSSFTNFFSRIDPRQINKRALENLIAAGAFDTFGASREQLIAGISRLLGHSARMSENAAIGMSDMFGGDASNEHIQLPLAETWLPAEKLNREFQSIGFYFSAHPLDEYQGMLAKMRVQNWTDFERAVKSGSPQGRLAGTVIQKQERKTRKGTRMGIIQLSDSSGQYEAVAFSETLERFRDLLTVGNSIMLYVAAENRDEGISLQLKSVSLLEDEASKIQKSLRVFVRDEAPIANIAAHLQKPGSGEVSIIVLEGDGEREIEVRLKGKKAISPPLASAMKAIPGVVEVELV